MTQIESVQPIEPCPCCGAAMRVFAQPSWRDDAPPLLLAHCETPGCPLRNATLTLGTHATLTPAQIAGYARVNGVDASDVCPHCQQPVPARYARTHAAICEAQQFVATAVAPDSVEVEAFAALVAFAAGVGNATGQQNEVMP